jgi:hypothetical protein
MATLEVDTWTKYKSAVAPDCLGIYTYTVILTYLEQTTTLVFPFVVNNPSAVITSDKQAFDKCSIPSTYQMQKWWDGSPYYGVNLYIGGISRGCLNTGLDAFWVHMVSQQGWEFIPTWVGPQAPCSSYKYRMSWDSATAYLQGRSEADAASAAAARLGMAKDRVIYYDLEGYYGASLACRATVKSFLSGWVQRLHELAAKAGVYGASCSSYMTDWASISPAIDNVWIAHWYKETYDPNASVWGAVCLSDSLWADHQRIRQYAGDHSETWGGVTFTIDSNIADGAVNSFPLGSLATAAGNGQSSTYEPLPEIRDMQLLSTDLGWSIRGHRFLWTADGGLTWKDITPRADASASLLSGFFLDERQGWLLFQDAKTGQLAVERTADGGDGWESYNLPASTSSGTPPIQSAFLSFIDAKNGWVALKLASSSNFSLGELYKTMDGGRTWTRFSLPIGAPVRFIDADHGWVAGGPAGDALFETLDGGETWHPQSFIQAEVDQPTQRFIGLPLISDSGEVFLPVTVSDPETPRVELFISRDGGATWNLSATISLGASAAPGGPIPLDLAGQGRFVVASPGTSEILMMNAESSVSEVSGSPGLPDAVAQMEFTNPLFGWVRVLEGQCSGYKLKPGETIPENETPFHCQMRPALYKTSDGGLTWIEITPEIE